MPKDRKTVSNRAHRRRIDENETRNRIRGCLFGGAIGDTVGYSIRQNASTEDSESQGTNYDCFGVGTPAKKSVISAYTQTALFTAVGLLAGKTLRLYGKSAQKPRYFVSLALQDWKITQTHSFEKGRSYHRGFSGGSVSWLRDIPELYARRDPDAAILTALSEPHSREPIFDFITDRYQVTADDGGCLPRIAPLALDRETARLCGRIEGIDREAAQIAAITHPHPVAYISAAVFCHILRQIVFCSRSETFSSIVTDALRTVRTVFPSEPETGFLHRLVDSAMELSYNNQSDEENIRLIGRGQTAAETLAVALYCTARYTEDFSAGVSAAARYAGNNAAAGAVTGNLLGAVNGFSAIDSHFMEITELSDLLAELADDLYKGCMQDEGVDRDWREKYLNMHRSHTEISDCSHIILGAVCGDITDTLRYDAVLYSDRPYDTVPAADIRVGQTAVIREKSSPDRILLKTVCPTWQGGKNGEPECLAASYRSALIAAAENGARNLAVFPVSVGTSDYPTEIAAKIAVRTVMEYIESNPGTFDKIDWFVKNRHELSVCRAQIERYDLDRLTKTPDSEL